jgi:aryl carrier-like protein
VRKETETERRLGEWWEELLGVGDVDREDHFFERGGDSIKAIRLAARAHAQGWKLGVQDIFDHPTVKALAAHMDTMHKSLPGFKLLPPGEDIGDGPGFHRLDWENIPARWGHESVEAAFNALSVLYPVLTTGQGMKAALDTSSGRLSLMVSAAVADGSAVRALAGELPSLFEGNAPAGGNTGASYAYWQAKYRNLREKEGRPQRPLQRGVPAAGQGEVWVERALPPPATEDAMDGLLWAAYHQVMAWRPANWLASIPYDGRNLFDKDTYRHAIGPFTEEVLIDWLKHIPDAYERALPFIKDKLWETAWARMVADRRVALPAGREDPAPLLRIRWQPEPAATEGVPGCRIRYARVRETAFNGPSIDLTVLGLPAAPVLRASGTSGWVSRDDLEGLVSGIQAALHQSWLQPEPTGERVKSISDFGYSELGTTDLDYLKQLFK